jgi:SPP1 family predicted phage head-tail adaptor
MRAGTLRQSIIIEQVTETRTASGAVTETWSTYATLRARQAITGGREFTTAQQLHSELSVLFACRYKSGVTSKMRVNHGGTYYGILSAYDPTGRGKELQIACKVID